MGRMRRTGATSAEIETLYRERFRAFLLTVTAVVGDGDAAYDVVQDAFAKAIERRRSFRREGTLEAWLWRIALNLARDRRRRRARVVEEAGAAEGAAEYVDELRAAVLALPERQRLTTFLRYYADLSYEEIAAVLGVRPGTVAATLHAAHRTLRERLQEEVCP